MSIENAISRIRRERGIKSFEFAEKLEINKAYFSEIENGNRNASIKLLRNICQLLEVSFARLLFESLDKVTIETKIEEFKNNEDLVNRMLNIL